MSLMYISFQLIWFLILVDIYLLQLVYSEQIRGYPRLRVMKLKCELFGMAGHYALALRPTIQDPGEPIAATTPKKSLRVSIPSCL